MDILAVIELLAKYAKAASALYEAASAMNAHLNDAVALVRKLQTEDRDPTPAEWAALDDAYDASKAALDAAIKRKS